LEVPLSLNSTLPWDGPDTIEPPAAASDSYLDVEKGPSTHEDMIPNYSRESDWSDLSSGSRPRWKAPWLWVTNVGLDGHSSTVRARVYERDDLEQVLHSLPELGENTVRLYGIRQSP
jgi:hypothetical protein